MTDRLQSHAIWERPDMRVALAQRDIAAVYALLQRHGMSQRRIAVWTDQTQSEVSEILGGRRVTSYDLLLRIATGLGVPRGRVGLAFDAETAALIGEPRPAPKLHVPPPQTPWWQILESLEGDQSP